MKAQGLYDPWYEHDSCGVGFIVDIKGRQTHTIVKQGLEILQNLEHRGACGCEVNTGDGSGILLQLPHDFLKKVATERKFKLPAPGNYAVGMIFLPQDGKFRREIEEAFEEIIKAEGQKFLGWRTVPTNNSSLGETAKREEPVIRQVFIAKNPTLKDPLSFERKLYVIRKRATNEIRHSGLPGGTFFYVCSLSSSTIVYKGMLNPNQMEPYFPDLIQPSFTSAMALVHSRFSTNTFPSWDRAHPYRHLAHNGEINTLRGNINWMHAREAMLESPLFGDDIEKVKPIVRQDGSDSAMFDNCFEFLLLSGRSLAHAAMMMVPEPWDGHESMSEEKKAFYEYHGCLMEPWDGPASIAFTDGVQIGAILDRNGLRPSRYYVTKDDLVIMASEVGVVNVEPERVLYKGRLQPGRMFLVDTAQGRIISDEEIKKDICGQQPYKKWLKANLVPITELPEPHSLPEPEPAPLVARQKTFGYTFEDLRMILLPMAKTGVEPLGAMGNDAALAVLSDKPQLLYNYFKQLFAQVTNPPVDSIREENIFSSLTMLGSEGNILDPRPESARFIKLKNPILTNEDLARVKECRRKGFKSGVLPIHFDASRGQEGLDEAIKDLFEKADQMIDEGINIIILSDRGVTGDKAPIPALLAAGGLHHHLILQSTRTRVSIVLESGEPREVHHFALLIGYGCSAINPYTAYESIEELVQQGLLPDIDVEKAKYNYIKAISKGIIKTMSKMGISTVKSYRGAQIFEAIGLNNAVVDKYFKGTASRIDGIGLDIIAKEVQMRHEKGFKQIDHDAEPLDPGGNYQWRHDGEKHLFTPQSIHALQSAVRSGSFDLFKNYSKLIDEQTKHLCTLRGLMDFKFPENPIPIEEVESVESIVKRFKTGAMSYGSISKEAHETLAIAMNRIGGKSNTGEGGEDASRYVPDANGDSRNSAIKQVASGRFGVTSFYLVNARELQIKMAQGAKPGEGGQLPGSKVYPWIAKTRHSTPGVGLISPPPHHDIYSIEDLAELIHDLKNGNRAARISVKLVSEVGVGTVAAGVAKAHADVVLISGYDGGTGASPLSSIKHAGIPWELGLAETHQTLVLNNLRSRIVVEVDGQLKTGRDAVIGALLGAEEFGFATGPLVSMGCIMMRVCHLNTCPAGVATQDESLRKKFVGKPEHVVNFMKFIAQEMREWMAKLGFRTINEMVGRADMLDMRRLDHWKAQGLDYSRIFHQPDMPASVGRYCQMAQDHGIEQSLDIQQLLKIAAPALEKGEKVEATLPIRNVNRVVGTILGSEVSKKYGAAGLPDDTIKLTFNGSAGQSFGAFVPRGITLTLQGDANDYLGKGLSGGKIIVTPSSGSTFVPRENMIIGNVALYGATAGEVYIHGMAGERFCVRNSGVNTVVEAIGDHGCEYMTGGRVIVLGATGRNFAAGMSGGTAYVLDTDGTFPSRCNLQMVKLEKLETKEEIEIVRGMIERHVAYTGSTHAKHILSIWEDIVPKFVKVLPSDYKRAMEAMDRVKAKGLSGDEAIMAAFEENAHDLARVGGN